MDTDIEDLLRDDESAFPSFDDDAPADDTEDQVKTDEKPDPTKAELAALRNELNELKSRPAPQQQSYVPPAAPAAPQKSREEIVKELETAFIANPGETLLKVLEASENIAKQNARSASLPAAQQSARLLAQNFKQSRKGDPFFKAAEAEFDALVSKVNTSDLANMDPDKLNESIETLYDVAVGKALRKRGGRASSPPPYSAGSSGGNRSGGSGAPAKLSAIQREQFRSLTEDYGYSEAEARKRLKELEEDDE